MATAWLVQEIDSTQSPHLVLQTDLHLYTPHGKELRRRRSTGKGNDHEEENPMCPMMIYQPISSRVREREAPGRHHPP